jgi:hypothetical protein
MQSLASASWRRVRVVLFGELRVRAKHARDI